MNKKQYSFMLVLALVAGLIGGVVSSQFFIGQNAFAKKKAEAKRIIEAEEFRLVDKSGRTHATLKLSGEPEQPELELVAGTDANYKTVLSPGMLWLQDGKNATRRYLSIHSGLHQIKEGHGIIELDIDGLKLFDRRGGRSSAKLLLGLEKIELVDEQNKVIWQAP